MKIPDMNCPLYNALDESIDEARRFIDRAEKAKRELSTNVYAWAGSKETAAAKRSSMDLTRSLVLVRKPII